MLRAFEKQVRMRHGVYRGLWRCWIDTSGVCFFPWLGFSGVLGMGAAVFCGLEKCLLRTGEGGLTLWECKRMNAEAPRQVVFSLFKAVPGTSGEE